MAPPAIDTRDPIAAFMAGRLSLEECPRASYFHTVAELQHDGDFRILAINYVDQLDTDALLLLSMVAQALTRAALAVKCQG
ncbi:MAG: hypothetical protein GEV06_09415 [Luteitalea sp.]|nr:hypothetical protein [Luteitalea sp.]